MDKEQVLEFVKKNVVSIAAVVVGLACFLVIIIVFSPKVEELQTQVTQRAGMQSTLKQLREKPRDNIKLKPGEAGANELVGFPTAKTIEIAEATMSEVKNSANALLDAAVSQNRRVPLDQPDYETATQVWPMESERLVNNRDSWLREYRRYINSANTFNDENGSYPAQSLPGLLNATRPVTAERIEAAKASKRVVMERDAPKRDGEVIDPEGLEKQIEDAQRSIETGLKYQRARQFTMYLDRGAVAVHPVANTETRPSPADMWEAQVQAWVQTTVGENLRNANINAFREAGLAGRDQNIINAPVKHVLSIAFPTTFIGNQAVEREAVVPAGGAGGAGGAAGGSPSDDPYGSYGGGPSGYNPYGGYSQGGRSTTTPPAGGAAGGRGAATGGRGAVGGRPAAGGGGAAGGADETDDTGAGLDVDAASQLDRKYQYGSFGRAPHTPFFDLVQFNLTLRVDAASVPYVLRWLQKDSFLSVLNVYSMTPVDPYVAEIEGYVYGPGATVELELQCEMLFLRNWTADLMPSAVKAELANWGPSE